MKQWGFNSSTFLLFAEDGRVKYKVSFDEKGKSLVSGHHIAFDTTPQLEQLFVGARVVVRCQDNKLQFRPGILAELPSRKNRLRCVIEWVFMFIILENLWPPHDLNALGTVWLSVIYLHFLGSWSFWMVTCQSMWAYLYFTWCADHVSLAVSHSLFFHTQIQLCRALLWILISCSRPLLLSLLQREQDLSKTD